MKNPFVYGETVSGDNFCGAPWGTPLTNWAPWGTPWHLWDALDKLDKMAGVNSRELWIATTQTR
jgi:hypothetical protein